MKIAIVAGGNIPSYWAHSINVMKHAQGFFKLNNEVEIFTIQRLQELKLRKKLEKLKGKEENQNKLLQLITCLRIHNEIWQTIGLMELTFLSF